VQFGPMNRQALPSRYRRQCLRRMLRRERRRDLDWTARLGWLCTRFDLTKSRQICSMREPGWTKICGR